MDIPKRLIECLTKNNVRYEILHHAEAFSAQRIAEAEHVKAEHHAKVMARSGEQHFMIVVPANRRVDLEKVEQITGQAVSLDTEPEFRSFFPTVRSERCHRLAIYTICQRL